jgi:hypothetical protein
MYRLSQPLVTDARSGSTTTMAFDPAWAVPGVRDLFTGRALSVLMQVAENTTGLVPITVAARLSRPVRVDVPATVEVTVTAHDRAMTEVTVSLSQGSVDCIAATVCLVHRGGRPSAWRDQHDLPALGPEHGELLELDPAAAGYTVNYEIRDLPPTSMQKDTPVRELTAWVRASATTDPVGNTTLAMLDLLPSPLYAIRTGPMPLRSVEFAAQLAPGYEPYTWTFLRQRCVWSTDTMCLDETAAFTSEGVMLGTARQVRRLSRGSRVGWPAYE